MTCISTYTTNVMRFCEVMCLFLILPLFQMSQHPLITPTMTLFGHARLLNKLVLKIFRLVKEFPETWLSNSLPKCIKEATVISYDNLKTQLLYQKNPDTIFEE